MPLFYTDSVTLAYSDVEAAKRWWIETFDCKVAKVPADWDCSRLACVVFCQKLKKGHEQLESRGVFAGPIQDGGDTQYFEIRDIEGNVIQICKEP